VPEKYIKTDKPEEITVSPTQFIDNTLWGNKMPSFFILDTSVKTDGV